MSSPKPKRPNMGQVGAAFGNMFGLSDAEAAFRELDINIIRPNPKQPRRIFDTDSLRELAQTIADVGVAQPILVRESLTNAGTFEIVAGERRWRASQMAGKTTIPALLKNVTDEEVAQLALVENVQRENLNAVDLAFALRTLIAESHMTLDRAGAVIGKSKVYVSRVMKICDLHAAILDEYRADNDDGARIRARVTTAQLMEIAAAKSTDVQLTAWEAAKAGVSSKALRDSVAEQAPAGTDAAPADNTPDNGKRARAVQAPLLTFRAIYSRWTKAFDQVPPTELEAADREVLRSLRDRLNHMDLG